MLFTMVSFRLARMCRGAPVNTHTHTQTSTGMQLAKGMSKDKIVLINCCGRGDKDMITVAKALGVNIDLSKEGQEQGRENKK